MALTKAQAIQNRKDIACGKAPRFIEATAVQANPFWQTGDTGTDDSLDEFYGRFSVINTFFENMGWLT